MTDSAPVPRAARWGRFRRVNELDECENCGYDIQRHLGLLVDGKIVERDDPDNPAPLPWRQVHDSEIECVPALVEHRRAGFASERVIVDDAERWAGTDGT